MKIDSIIGIDPGANGGIAVWKLNHIVTAVKMPRNIHDINDYLRLIAQDANPIIFLEKLNVRLSDAEGGKLFRIQKMLQNYEQLKSVISLLDIPYVLVNPMKWQQELKLRITLSGKKEEKKDRKNRYKEIAGRLYPEVKPTLWSSDAILIMHFGRYILKNNPEWVISNLPLNLKDRLF